MDRQSWLMKEEKSSGLNKLIRSIFYVGRGVKGRPLDHIYKAYDPTKKGNKLTKIRLSLSRKGVIIVSFRKKSGALEAASYEATLIEKLLPYKFLANKRVNLFITYFNLYKG